MQYSSMLLAADMSESVEVLDSLTSNFSTLGIDFFEGEIDNVLFMTNEFLTDGTFYQSSGPFWWILQMCMTLGAMFAIIMGAGMAYKMMVKGETFDVLKILKVLGVAIVMCWWYPGVGGSTWCFLDFLAYIPNSIGSYTNVLYQSEALVVQERFNQMMTLVERRDTLVKNFQGEQNAAVEGIKKNSSAALEGGESDAEILKAETNAAKLKVKSDYAGLIILLDKLIMMASLIIYRVGWWATIYCQQILLAMLTIFGPIMWAFSLLPKWEGAWAKWITRYLTVHFYGAMLYFVGFYVLLLFDIVVSIQYEELAAALETEEHLNWYMQNAFMTAGYLMVASLVSLKCLNLVPDLAAWMIPEGDTIFSARSFGEGVASEMRSSAKGMLNGKL